jgi:hypothetical protein
MMITDEDLVSFYIEGSKVEGSLHFLVSFEAKTCLSKIQKYVLNVLWELSMRVRRSQSTSITVNHEELFRTQHSLLDASSFPELLLIGAFRDPRSPRPSLFVSIARIKHRTKLWCDYIALKREGSQRA